MTNLQELIDTAYKLSETLEKASNDERKFCFDVQHALEIMSWEMLKHANELKEIKNYI